MRNANTPLPHCQNNSIVSPRWKVPSLTNRSVLLTKGQHGCEALFFNSPPLPCFTMGNVIITAVLDWGRQLGRRKERRRRLWHVYGDDVGKNGGGWGQRWTSEQKKKKGVLDKVRDEGLKVRAQHPQCHSPLCVLLLSASDQSQTHKPFRYLRHPHPNRYLGPPQSINLLFSLLCLLSSPLLRLNVCACQHQNVCIHILLPPSYQFAAPNS